ncbi:MAG: hypothetical protein M3Q05_13830, partial [Bacteroidota bacterium]|nr:hypothetical protein [Bacteroidota bacterium]
FEEEDSLINSEKPVSNHQERIGGKRRDATLPTQAPKVRISKNPNLVIQWNELNDHLQIGIQNNNRNYLMCQTLENYFQPTARRVKQGTPSSTLSKQYGKPTYTFAGTMGEYWIYANNKIAFNLDKDGKVNSWLIYTRTL